jgi:type IV pilus assembly protein PilA
MLSKIRRRAEDEQGFTLIELLVVILIIGILAAIAIPSFLNQRGKGNDASSKSQARTAQTAMETYATDNSGAYTGADKAALVGIESQLGDQSNAVLTVGTVAADSYSLTSTDPQTGNAFTIARSNTGVVTRTCTVAGKGGCAASGTW